MGATAVSRTFASALALSKHLSTVSIMVSNSSATSAPAFPKVHRGTLARWLSLFHLTLLMSGSVRLARIDGDLRPSHCSVGAAKAAERHALKGPGDSSARMMGWLLPRTAKN